MFNFSSKKAFFSKFDPKIYFITIQEIAVLDTAMTHIYWTALFIFRTLLFIQHVQLYMQRLLGRSQIPYFLEYKI